MYIVIRGLHAVRVEGEVSEQNSKTLGVGVGGGIFLDDRLHTHTHTHIVLAGGGVWAERLPGSCPHRWSRDER